MDGKIVVVDPFDTDDARRDDSAWDVMTMAAWVVGVLPIAYAAVVVAVAAADDVVVPASSSADLDT